MSINFACGTGTPGADGVESVSGAAEAGADGQGPEAALRGPSSHEPAAL